MYCLEHRVNLICIFLDYSCEARYKSKAGLNAHVSVVHEGKKPLTCDICNKGFTQQDHLNRHVAGIHERKRPFKCDVCMFSALYPSELKEHFTSKKHIKRTQSIKKEVDDTQSNEENGGNLSHFSCFQCPERFESLEKLDEHFTTFHDQ